jgi:hypothetical protein
MPAFYACMLMGCNDDGSVYICLYMCLCVCVCVCIYVYVYTCIDVCMYVSIHFFYDDTRCLYAYMQYIYVHIYVYIWHGRAHACVKIVVALTELVRFAESRAATGSSLR